MRKRFCIQKSELNKKIGQLKTKTKRMFISNTAMKGYRFDKGLCLKNSFGRRSNITAERFLGHYRFIPDSELY